MGNGEITVDGQYVTGMTVDGQEVIEVSIDGCTFGFEELIRTGYFAITGGSGSKVIDLSEARTIVEAGIRFRGRTPVTYNGITSGDYTDWVVTSSTNYKCTIEPDIPSLPSKYACAYVTTGYSLKYMGSKSPSSYGVCVRPVFEGGACTTNPSVTFPLTSSIKSSPSDMVACVAAMTSDGEDVAGKALARRHWRRTCYSADTTVKYPGGLTAEYPLILSSGSRAPNSSGTGVVECPDESGDLFWAIPLPNLVFDAGVSNTIQFTEVLGSGNVDVELYIVYR